MTAEPIPPRSSPKGAWPIVFEVDPSVPIGEVHFRQHVTAMNIAHEYWLCLNCYSIIRERELGGKNDNGVGHLAGDDEPYWCGPCEPFDADELAEMLRNARHGERAAQQEAERLREDAERCRALYAWLDQKHASAGLSRAFSGEGYYANSGESLAVICDKLRAARRESGATP